MTKFKWMVCVEWTGSYRWFDCRCDALAYADAQGGYVVEER